jgi:hypothetical protein
MAWCAGEPIFGEQRVTVGRCLDWRLSVPRNTASWVVGLVLLGGASMVSISGTGAGNAVSAAPVSCGPQLMLYVTVPLSSHGSSSLPRYGLRIGEFRKRPTTPQLLAVAPVQRELVDLQIVPHSDVRVEFGRRLVWDIQRGAFGRQSNLATLAIGVPIKGTRLSDSVNEPTRQPWDGAPAGMSAWSADATRTRQLDGERLAIVAAVIPLHWTSSDGRPVYMQLRPTISLVNAQPSEAVLPPRSAAP